MNIEGLRSASWLTRRRAGVYGAIFAAIFLAVLAVDFAGHAGHGVTDAAGEHLARDFANYWSGARLAATGRATAAYDVPAYLAYQRSVFGPASEFKLYSYPPVAMLLTLPLAAFGYVAGLMLWLALGLLLVARLLARPLGRGFAALAAIGSPAAFVDFYAGQNGHLSAALFAGAMLVLERRPALAGVLIGTLCYKPQFGLLLPLALAAGGRWRCFAAAAATVALLVGASILLFGAAPWLGFFRQLRVERILMESEPIAWARNPTVFAAVRLIGLPTAAAYALQAVSSLAAAAATVLAWRSSAPLPLKGAVLALALFLATPYAWDYDMVVLLFVVAWLVEAARTTGFLPWEKLAMAGLLLLPVLMPILGKALHLQIGPAVLYAVLLLLLRRVLAAERAAPALAPEGVA